MEAQGLQVRSMGLGLRVLLLRSVIVKHTHTHTLYTVNMQQQTIIFYFVMLHFFQEQLLT